MRPRNPARPRAPWAVLALLPFLQGCTAVAPAPAPPPPAHLVVTNLTDYRWHIVISRPSGQPVRDFEVKARASSAVDLDGADYVIDQDAVAGSADPELARRLSVHLDPGEAYGWRLATLLSASPTDAGAQEPSR